MSKRNKSKEFTLNDIRTHEITKLSSSVLEYMTLKTSFKKDVAYYLLFLN